MTMSQTLTTIAFVFLSVAWFWGATKGVLWLREWIDDAHGESDQS